MLSICQICLSTDRTLQGLKEPLSNWHDELCDFGIEDYALYCSECAYLLNKFHNFKDKCLKANKILKKWKRLNPKVRKQLSQLKKEMPPSPIGISNINNHKVYFYLQDPTEKNYSILYKQLTCPKNVLTCHSGFIVDTSAPVHTTNEGMVKSDINSSISEINILISHEDTAESTVKFFNDTSADEDLHEINKDMDKGCELKTILIEPCNENEFLKESEVKIEENVLNNTETVVVDELQVKDDFDDGYYIDSDHNISSNGGDCSDFDIEKLLSKSLESDDSSDDEVPLKKRKKETDSKTKQTKKKIQIVKDEFNGDSPNKLNKKVDIVKDSALKKKKSVRPISGSLKKLNLESMKYNLLCKFGNKELKDEDGNVIDKDCIIESLDKMHVYTLNKVKRNCLGPKPFTPEAVHLLSQIQKRYGNQFSSVFTTEHLTNTEQILEEFCKRQQHESFLGSDHKCMLCYRGFKHKKLLEYHANEYHNPGRPHVCVICQMRFKAASGLCKHNAAHRVVYKCKLCPLVTNYRTVMENHYNQHNGVTYTCEICKAVLNSKTSLNAHINYLHPSQYICPICARTFVSEWGVSQHKLRKHSNEEIAEGAESKSCESCNVTFISDSVYQKHMMKSHADKSNTASYAFTYKKRQMTGKRQTPNFICRVCKKVEHSIGKLTWHFKTEHPNENTDTMSMCAQTYKHLCHVCGKGYTSITDFNEHKHLHTGARPYACDKCPKAFHRKTNLRSHLERHFPPTRECQHCGKKFLSAANLNNHMRMHIGIRRYTCELCAKSFLHRSALNAHVRGVHLRIRRTRKTNKEQAEG